MEHSKGYDAVKLKEELEAADGNRILDLSIHNIKLVNVFTNEIYPASIGIYGNRIVSVMNDEKIQAHNVIDGEGCYAVPGFIDAHMHIETTLLTPEALSEVITPWGSTSLCADAMEIANVAGIKGLLALMGNAENLPIRLFMEVPSRVPTAPGLESTGGILGVEEVIKLLETDMAISLGELDSSKIMAKREEYLEKVLSAYHKNKICNGHAIGLNEAELNVYATGHLSDDHESVYYEELINRLRLGIKPMIREGSSERNTEGLIKGVLKHHIPLENLMFCTDDKHVNDIFREGHISYNIQKAINLGMDPVEAIKIATINTAKHFRMEDRIGCLAPGRFADIVLLKDLKRITPFMVLKDGKVVADQNGVKPCDKINYPQELFDTVHIRESFSKEDFSIKTDGMKAKCRVIHLMEEQIINEEKQEWMEVHSGEINADLSRDILKLAVVERYGKTGGVSTALVHGFGLKQGAMASSVSHDHHNIVVVGTNDEDMERAVKEVERLHGGFVYACDGVVIDSLSLPLGGLMSTLTAKEVLSRMESLNKTVMDKGCKSTAPFMALSFISLPTVPQLGLTDLGLIDVKRHCLTDLILETKRVRDKKNET